MQQCRLYPEVNYLALAAGLIGSRHFLKPVFFHVLIACYCVIYR